MHVVAVINDNECVLHVKIYIVCFDEERSINIYDDEGL